jgi:hypothetical protein
VTVQDNLVTMDDVQTTWPGIFVQAEDALIERNVVRVQRRLLISKLPFGNLGRLLLARPPEIKTFVMHPQGSEPAVPGAAPAPSLTHVAMHTAAMTAALATPAVSLTHAVALPPPAPSTSVVDALFAGPGVTARLGLGGIQIGGLSERVRVVDNLVQGGAGNGITLGSIRLVNREGIDLRLRLGWFIDLNLEDDGSPCLPGRVVVVDPPDDSPPDVPIPVPAGPLRDIAIEGNRIFDAGLNGIGVVGFFSPLNKWVGRRIISVEGLTIDNNEIRRCLTRPVAPTGEADVAISGFGGISLADVDGLAIRRNVIEDNGADYLDPICGVFLLNGEGVEIADNRIINNGAPTREPPASARPGRRGGIHIVMCSAPVDLPLPMLAIALFRGRQNGTPALRVRDNVVSAPLGQALVAAANGPVLVHGNSFTSLGIVPRPAPLQHGLFGATVNIVNLGRSAEEKSTPKYFTKVGLVAQMFAMTAANVDPSKFHLDPAIRTEGVEVNALAPGFVQFSDNQCQFAGTLLRPPRFLGTIPIDLAKAVGLAGAKLAAEHDESHASSGTGGMSAVNPAPAAAAAAGGTPVSMSFAATAGAAGGTPLTNVVSAAKENIVGAKEFGDYSKAIEDFPVADPAPTEIVSALDKMIFQPLSPDHPDIVKPVINPGAMLNLDLTLRLSSVSIWTLDDIGVHDNQCLTTIPEGTLLTQLFTFGDSVRTTGNRFKEGAQDAIFSAITLGQINVTAHNEATHCLVVRPKPVAGQSRSIDGPNIVTLTGTQLAQCQAFETAFGDFGRLGG